MPASPTSTYGRQSAPSRRAPSSAAAGYTHSQGRNPRPDREDHRERGSRPDDDRHRAVEAWTSCGCSRRSPPHCLPHARQDRPMNASNTPARYGRPLLEVTGLSVDFAVDNYWVPAAKNLDLHRRRRRSRSRSWASPGSGKSASSMAMLGLLPSNARITGSVKLGGREILGLQEGRAAPGPRQRDRRHLPGADDGAEPGLHRGLPDHRDAAHPLRHHAERGEGPRARSCSTSSSCPTR